MRSRLNPLPSLVTATLLLAVTSPLPMAANPLGDRTTRYDANPNREAHAEQRRREQRIQQSNDNLDPLDSNDVIGSPNSSPQVNLLFDDDEKQATPRRVYTPPMRPIGDRDIIPDPPPLSSPSSNRNTVPYTPPNVAKPSGDRDTIPGGI